MPRIVLTVGAVRCSPVRHKKKGGTIHPPAAWILESTMPEDTEGSIEGAGCEPARRRFARRVDALPDLFAFCESFCAANGVGDARRSTADFVLEELFTNLVKYNADGASEIEVGLRRAGSLFEISMTDFDSERFDPREEEEVAVDAPLTERTPGGLGIHLVKKFAKRIDYDYVDRRSRVTIYLDLG